MALLTGITTHSEIMSFTGTLAGVVIAANDAITAAEDAALENQSVDISDKNTVWDGTDWNLVITIKTVTNNNLTGI